MLLVTCYMSLVSCGFHLRGAVELPSAMERTYIVGAGDSSLYYELESALLAAGAQVVKNPEAATAILTIHGEDYRRRVLSVDTAGRASEYELRLRIVYSLSEPDGEMLAMRDEVVQLRDYRFDPDNVLASGGQEELLQNEMRRSAVRQLLRRLQSRIRNPKPQAKVSSKG